MTPSGEEFISPPRFYRFGELEVDLSEETLRRGSEKLNINNRMFQVLSLLIERKGEIISKDVLSKKVWNGSFVEDNNLTVTITAIRKVLGDDARGSELLY
jgi:DNA-binding winged helix-turn-helix (wHTH) protein